MAPVYLAGAFARERCDVRIHNEQFRGPLTDPNVLAWPDMLVLTGLTGSFDRMLHLTAYARTLNSRVVVAAGGPAIRALPTHASRFFDHPCTGDVEQLREVIGDALGADYVADEMLPRFDLADWIGRWRYMETSRYCNFRCAFCSLTAERRAYRGYALDEIRRNIVALGRGVTVVFIDNNFYGNDRSFFLERIDLLRELYRDGQIAGWGGLVTSDFFLRDENVTLARESGCGALFSGVESFNPQVLRGFRKMQNTRMPQVEMISKCLDAGIAFLYGLIFDPASRRLDEMQAELDFVTGSSEVPLPAFATLAIPLLGTPFFDDCVTAELFLPHTKLRDLDGSTLVLRPLDPLDDVRRFVHALPGLGASRGRILRHAIGFYRRYRRSLDGKMMATSLAKSLTLSLPSLVNVTGRAAQLRAPARTHVTTTEPLEPLYTPAFRVEARYREHFHPTMVTDGDGHLSEELAPDLARPRPTRIVTSQGSWGGTPH